MVEYAIPITSPWIPTAGPPKDRWHKYFWDLAHVVASNSQCLSRQIGAVIARDKLILSTGYNGPPRGVPRCDERWGRDKSLERYTKLNYLHPSPTDLVGECPRYLLDFKTGEALHLCPSAHAEANAIVSAARLGHAIEGATMYVTCGTPCKDCLGLIINAGLIEVVCTSTDAYDELSNLLVLQANLRITTYL